jgi:hypothetical protein
MLNSLEFRGEEIILTRSRHKIARINPGSPHLTALQSKGDLYRTCLMMRVPPGLPRAACRVFRLPARPSSMASPS